MKKPNVQSVKTIGSWYEAVVLCKCGETFTTRFTSEIAGIKTLALAQQIAEIYADKTAPLTCFKCL